MKIAVIDNYDSFVYNLVRYVEEESDAEVIVMRNQQIDFDFLKEVDAILLSPGPGIPSEAGQLMKVIEEFHKTKPIFGVCLGHQAIAEFFGNSLEICTLPFHGESSEIQILEQDFIFKELNKAVVVGRYHSWMTQKDLKEPLIITALTIENEVMAFRHEKLPIHGVQFHPESILTPEGRKMINNWLKTLKETNN